MVSGQVSRCRAHCLTLIQRPAVVLALTLALGQTALRAVGHPLGLVEHLVAPMAPTFVEHLVRRFAPIMALFCQNFVNNGVLINQYM